MIPSLTGQGDEEEEVKKNIPIFTYDTRDRPNAEHVRFWPNRTWPNRTVRFGFEVTMFGRTSWTITRERFVRFT